MVKPRSEIFKNVLLDLATREAEQYANLSEAPFSLSSQFDSKMNKLIKAQNHWSWPLIKNTKRKIVTTLLAAILLFTLSLGISAVRESVFSFFSDVYGKFTAFYTQESYSSNNAPTVIEKKYTLSWLSNNCTLKEKLDYGVSVNTIWVYEDNEIVFEQCVSSASNLILDNESETYSKYVIGNTEYYYVLKNKTYCFLWTNGDYSFMLTLPEDISWETTQTILASFVEIK